MSHCRDLQIFFAKVITGKHAKLREAVLFLCVTQRNENASDGRYKSSTNFLLLWHVLQMFGVLSSMYWKHASINFAKADCRPT